MVPWHNPSLQFQDEFYSASSKHANGFVSFPEFGKKNGRLNFFIQLKKWGIEMPCDGNRLGQHARRFTEGEYDKWIEKGWMSDYIIIDFRTRRPKIMHRGKLVDICHIILRYEQTSISLSMSYLLMTGTPLRFLTTKEESFVNTVY